MEKITDTVYVLRFTLTAQNLCTSKVHFCMYGLQESCYLLPGDTFLSGGKRFCLPCDAVLIDGSCTVNEGMFSGTALEIEMLRFSEREVSLSVLTANYLLFICVVCSRREKNCGLINSQFLKLLDIVIV